MAINVVNIFSKQIVRVHVIQHVAECLLPQHFFFNLVFYDFFKLTIYF